MDRHVSNFTRRRQHLRERYGFRCGYCKRTENDLGGSDEFFAIDHFRPRALFPAMADEAENLVYCCATCNRIKGAQWPVGSAGTLLHPLNDEWPAHIRETDSGILQPITEAGRITIELLHLNRYPLVRHRRVESGEGDLLYEAPAGETTDDVAAPVVLDIDREILAYLAAHPDQLYNLTPRRFEELVAAILKDLGLEVELTQATRDGGVDIYAFVQNAVAGFLMVVECKRWAPDKAVGVGVVQRLYGVQQAQAASKSLIVTTSYFSAPAVDQCKEYRGLMELKGFEDLKVWLGHYVPTR